jgi:large subunit ribosomal protein L12
MEYVYAALLLHKAGKKIDEASVKKVVEAAGIKSDSARIKALVASLEGVKIEEAISKAPAVAVAASAPSAADKPAAEEKKEEKEEEEEEISESAAAEGLGALFG